MSQFQLYRTRLVTMINDRFIKNNKPFTKKYYNIVSDIANISRGALIQTIDGLVEIFKFIHTV
jgi:hypothetical protein